MTPTDIDDLDLSQLRRHVKRPGLGHAHIDTRGLALRDLARWHRQQHQFPTATHDHDGPMRVIRSGNVFSHGAEGLFTGREVTMPGGAAGIFN